MKRFVIPVIIVLLLLYALSNLGVYITESAFWQSHYGMFSEKKQMSMLFWAFMLLVVFTGVIYLWRKKAI